jgi:ABC-2 type transport system permease protein
MKIFYEILRFELRHLLRSPSVWIYSSVLLLLAFLFIHVLAGAFGGIAIALSGDNTHINSESMLSLILSLLSLLGTFIAAIIAGRVATKEFECNSFSQSFTLPVTRFQYISGKYVSVFLITLLIFAFAALGIFAGTAMPYLDQKMMGEFRLLNYLYPFLNIIAINVFLLTAFFFSLGLLTRSIVSVWTGVVLLYGFYWAAMHFLNEYNHQQLAVLLDPFGIAGCLSANTGQSADQLNKGITDKSHFLLYNRCLWSLVALTVLVLTLIRFKFRFSPATGFSHFRRRKGAEEFKPASQVPYMKINLPPVHAHHNLKTAFQKFIHLIRHECRITCKSLSFKIIGLVLLVVVFTASKAIGKIYDTETYPVTCSITEIFMEATKLIIFVVITLFSGEMVWRDRILNTHYVGDTLPLSTGIKLGSKIFAMVIVILGIFMFEILAGMITQWSRDYHTYEPVLYLKYFFGIKLPEVMLTVLLAFSIQIFSPGKYTGYFVMIVYYLWNTYFAETVLQHNLLVYNSGPPMLYSDLDGFGYQPLAFFAFKLYWFLFISIPLLVGSRIYPSGTEIGYRNRWLKLKQSIGRQNKSLFITCCLAFLATGIVLFYQINVKNEFTTTWQEEERSAQYEKKYATLSDKEQPVVKSTRIYAEVYPENGGFHEKSESWLKNEGIQPIFELYLNYNENNVSSITFNRSVTPGLRDTKCNFYSYLFDKGIQPGDSVLLSYCYENHVHGIANNGITGPARGNGSFIECNVVAIGYQRDAELQLNRIREKHNLPQKDRYELSYDDPKGIKINGIGAKSLIRFDLTAGTSTDQTILAPGELSGQWKDTLRNRNYFHYTACRPVNNLYTLVSARYAVVEDTWIPADSTAQPVKLRIYYHPSHTYALKSIMNGMKEALTYCSSHYSPFQYKSLCIAEFPRFSSFAQSFPGLIPFSESIGFVADLRAVNMNNASVLNDATTTIDYPFFVTAHEVAHQWWAHQVCGADVEGSSFLIETMAQYSSLMTMKHHYGENKMRKFLSVEVFQYLNYRNRENREERPLETVLSGQTEIYYRKGGVLMYALQDYLGEEKVSKVLHDFILKYAFKNAPYPTAHELIDDLEKVTPDSLKYLIHDWFKTITLYQNKIIKAAYSRNEDLEYSISFTTTIHKFQYDEKGTEKETAVKDYIEFGMYDTQGKEIFLKKLLVKQGENKFTIHLGRRPETLVLDPYNKLLDKDWLLKKVKVEKNEGL